MQPVQSNWNMLTINNYKIKCYTLQLNNIFTGVCNQS